jgi:CheY-like chemotaxis protein
LRGLRILVVEDTMLIADVIVDELETCGCKVIGPAGRLAHAIELAQEAELDGALLDVNLAGEECFPAAEVLAERNIPFIFLTGYDNPSLFPPKFRDHPRVMKPFDEHELLKLIARFFHPAPTAAGPV